MWVKHRVPFHYVWTEELSTNNRFHRWDPVTIGAFNKTTHKYDARTMSQIDPLHSDSIDYDEWLQQ